MQKPLPGKISHQKLMPETRKKELVTAPVSAPKKSAVLFLLYPVNNVPFTVLIKRAVDGGVHSNQIAFPGGSFEESDNNFINTALRESYEELNIIPDNVNVLGQLSKLYIPPSNFDVFPVVGYSNVRPGFKANEEVQEIFEIDIRRFFSSENFQYKTIKYRTGENIEVPCYYIKNQIIWGATAMIISEFKDVVLHA